LQDISFVSKDDHKEIYSRADVKKNDILYIKDGVKTGIAAVNSLEEEFSLLSSVGVFRTNHNFIHPKYLCHFLNSPITRKRMLSHIAGVAITRLTLVKLNNSLFAFAPHNEQLQIIQEIETRLSVCEKLEQTIDDSLKKSEALRQSILKKAFSGELTRTWREKHPELVSGEHSAQKLLERIKAEKAKAEAELKKSRSTRSKKKNSK
jgi:type I restriction enzyme S subunit